LNLYEVMKNRFQAFAAFKLQLVPLQRGVVGGAFVVVVAAPRPRRPP
jgi:hypothetical protein